MRKTGIDISAEDLEVRYPEPVLCFIKKPWAWFTTRQLDKQWGPGWDRAPYERHAEWPLEWHRDIVGRGPPYKLVQLAFTGPFDVIAERGSYSVEEINRDRLPWLCGPSWLLQVGSIHAGTPLRRFMALIEAAGGTVFSPREKPPTDLSDLWEEHDRIRSDLVNVDTRIDRWIRQAVQEGHFEDAGVRHAITVGTTAGSMPDWWAKVSRLSMFWRPGWSASEGAPDAAEDDAPPGAADTATTDPEA